MVMPSCVSKKKYQEAVARGKYSLDSLNKVFDKTVAGFNSNTNYLKNSNSAKDLRLDSLNRANNQLTADKASLNQNLVQTINYYKAERDKLATKSRAVDSLMNILNIQAVSQDSARNISDTRMRKLDNYLTTSKRALDGLNQSEAYAEIKAGVILITFSNDFLFKSGTNELSTKGLTVIKKLSILLSSTENCTVTVVSHTDSNGQAKSLLDQSARKAAATVTAFAENSTLPGSAYTASGKGMYSPLATNTNDANKKKNRRTEVFVNPGY
jgi:chemotaxis protein MotB